MKSKSLLYLIIGIIALVIIGLIVGFWPKQTTGQEPILYVSNTCLHCKNVEDFISANGIADKIKYQTKEVSQDPANAQDLIAKAQQCKIDQNNVGVPLLWTNGQCIIGDQQIIDYFKEQTGMSAEATNTATTTLPAEQDATSSAAN